MIRALAKDIRHGSPIVILLSTPVIYTPSCQSPNLFSCCVTSRIKNLPRAYFNMSCYISWGFPLPSTASIGTALDAISELVWTTVWIMWVLLFQPPPPVVINMWGWMHMSSWYNRCFSMRTSNAARWYRQAHRLSSSR